MKIIYQQKLSNSSEIAVLIHDQTLTIYWVVQRNVPTLKERQNITLKGGNLDLSKGDNIKPVMSDPWIEDFLLYFYCLRVCSSLHAPSECLFC